MKVFLAMFRSNSAECPAFETISVHLTQPGADSAIESKKRDWLRDYGVLPYEESMEWATKEIDVLP